MKIASQRCSDDEGCGRNRGCSARLSVNRDANLAFRFDVRHKDQCSFARTSDSVRNDTIEQDVQRLIGLALDGLPFDCNLAAGNCGGRIDPPDEHAFSHAVARKRSWYPASPWLSNAAASARSCVVYFPPQTIVE